VSFRRQHKIRDFSSLKWLWDKGTEKGEKREKKQKIVLELTLRTNAMSAGRNPYWGWNSTLRYSAVQICLTGDGCAQGRCHNNREHADICIRGSVYSEVEVLERGGEIILTGLENLQSGEHFGEGCLFNSKKFSLRLLKMLQNTGLILYSNASLRATPTYTSLDENVVNSQILLSQYHRLHLLAYC